MNEARKQFSAAAHVRLRYDSSRRGVLTGRTRVARGDGNIRYEVVFTSGKSWVPSDQLELMPDTTESPYDLLRNARFGTVYDLRRTLTHVRLTGRLAEVIYSMEATNTDFYPYQFKPVLRFLNSPTNSLLIADEVGLGKTIEAGLIWTELKSRNDFKRLVILCPAVLCEKWKTEFRDKIGVKAEIVKAKSLLDRLKSPQAALDGFALICSIQGARPNRDWENGDVRNASKLARFLRSKESEESLIDLLIVDEAHYLRNPASQTNTLVELFRPVTENLLLLSATPLHNSNQDLLSLLHVLDPNTFQRMGDLTAILEACRPLNEARDHVLGRNVERKWLLSKIEEANRFPLLANSRQLAHAMNIAKKVDFPQRHDDCALLAKTLESVNPLAYVITRTRKRDVTEWRVIRRPLAIRVQMSDYESKLYSQVTDLVIDYALERGVSEGFILSSPQRQISSSMAASVRAWQLRRQNMDDYSIASADSKKTPEIGPLTELILSKCDEFVRWEILAKHDSKFHEVSHILDELFSKSPNEKVVLFSTFRGTLDYLHYRLNDIGISSVVLHGGISQEKHDVLTAFEHDPNVRILLSSEVGSEGLDMQFCRVLINYDLPWNPMRVEQRIGRLDRLGQKAKRIDIWNLMYDATIDSRIYEKLYEKLDLCKNSLGDFEAVLGERVGKLTSQLLSNHLTAAQQEAMIDQTALALANLRQEHEELEDNASHLVAYGDYILNKVHAAKEMRRWISGSDLKNYVIDYLKESYPGCTIEQRGEDTEILHISLSNDAKHDLADEINKKRLNTTRLTSTSSRPTCCQFDNRPTNFTSSKSELITQFHPLVRFVSERISERDRQVTPAVAVIIDDYGSEMEFMPGEYLVAVSRWIVEGIQTKERLAFSGYSLKKSCLLDEESPEKLLMIAASKGSDWYEARSRTDLSELSEIADQIMFRQIDNNFVRYIDEVRRRNGDRADIQERNIDRHLESLVGKLSNVLDAHMSNGKKALASATEGRIRAAQNRADIQKRNLQKQRSLMHDQEEILTVLIRISAPKRI